MKNDRERRGGKAGGKGGRIEGRGKGSSQQHDGKGDRGDRANGVDSGGGGSGTGGAPGGKTQQRRGGRGGSGGRSGGKRGAGSADAAAGGAGAAGALSAGSKPQKAAGSRANKKARTKDTNVLWSPGKGKGRQDGGDGGGGGGGVSGGGENGGGNGGAPNLLALAKDFKERFGEEVASDGDGDDAMAERIDGLEPRGRKRGPGGGGRSTPRRPAEEAARSMSPAQLAAEVQKARARAREARFGGGGGGGGGGGSTRSSSSTPLPPAPQPRSLSIGNPAAASGGKPSGAAAPLKRSLVGVTKISDPSRPHFVAPASPSPPPPPPPQPDQQQQGPSGSNGSFPATPAKVATVLKEANGYPSGSTPPRAVSPVATASATSVPISAAAGRAAAPGSSAAAPILVRPDPEEVDTSAPSKTGRAAGPPAGTAAEAIPVDETPTDTKGAAPKRSAPTGGDVVVIEPPAKKLLPPPPRTGSSPPPSSSPRSPAAVPVAIGKTLTLRLRLRTDFAAAEAKQPASTAAPAAARVGDDGAGGVEECKGFKPPNPPPDAGVEECKGFDPPNLSAAPAPQLRDPATSPSPTVMSCAASTAGTMAQTAVTSQPKPSVPSATISVGPRDVVAAAASSAATTTTTTTTTTAPAPASHVRTATGEGPPVDASSSPGEGSWGPSFGISGASAPAGRTRSVPATPAPSPTAVRPKTNPWILSSEAPTFARNRGRPLAQSFPTARKSGGSSSSNSAIDTAGRKNPGPPGRGTFSGGGGAHGVGGGGSGSGTIGSAKAPGGGGDVGDCALPARALPPSSASAGSNLLPPSATQTRRVLQEEVAVDSATAAALAAVTGAGIGAAGARARASAEGVEAGVVAPADAHSGQLVLGVQLGGRAGELLERLKREREESLDFERKLTQALLDL